MDTVNLSLIVLAALAVVAIAVLAARLLTAPRAQAQRQIKAWLATGAARQLGLGPGAQAIAHEYEATPRPGDPEDAYALTVLLRNSSGHYVMLKAGPAGSHARLMAPGAAKALLKHKYVPPPD